MGDIKTRFSLEGESQFRSAMTNAANAIKVLNAEQKLAKASFQQTGDAEKYAAAQASILQQKITQQKAAVQAAEQAIKQLTDNGVSPASRQFQQWQTKLYNAQTALTNMESELQAVNGTMQQTSTTAEGTSTAIESIGKKVNLDAVINGIGKVTGALEAAAQKAAQFAKEIISFTREAAKEADEIATDATVYDYTTQEIQQMRYTADILDTSFEAIMKSRQKLANAMQGDKDIFTELGVALREDVNGMMGPQFNNYVIGKARSMEDVFWDLGDALVRIQDEKGFEYVNKQATQLFGKSWEQLRPIFASDWASEDNYLGKAFNSAREYYEAVMASWDVNSDETIKNLTKYDDSIQKLENNFKTLKNTVAGELAPGFQQVTDFIGNLVSEFNKYLESDEGQEKLQDLSDAIVSLFQGLEDVDFGEALELAKGAIDSLKTGLEWISNHGSEVATVVGGIATAFAGLKVAEGVLTFMQLLASGKYLFSNGQITGYDSGGGGGGDVVATGGSGSEVGQFEPNFWDKVVGWTNGFILNNAAVVYDWATHEGPFGGIANGTQTWEDLGRDFENWQRDVVSNVMNFFQDWAHFGDENYDFENHREIKLEPEVEIPKEDLKAQFDALTSEEKMQMEVEFVFGDSKSKVPNETFWNNYLPETPELPAEIESETDAEDIVGQVGSITLPATLQVVGYGGGGGGVFDYVKGHANGLASVPFDGYPAILHKGERVMPAREVQSRSYNSNLYVESMYMNNGTDAEGLAAAMAAAQRRTSAGFGS